jgi:hypothetical protein
VKGGIAQLLVTSAGSTNGGGYSAILNFDAEGELMGFFSSDPRIVDPRSLCIDPSGALIYVNSADRMLALDRSGRVVCDSGPMADLDPGGAVFGPDGRVYVTMRRRRTILAMPAALDGDPERFCLMALSHSLAGSASRPTAGFTSRRASDHPGKALT